MVSTHFFYWNFQFFRGLIKIPFFNQSKNFLIAFSGGQDSLNLLILWMNLHPVSLKRRNASIWCNHLWKQDDFYLFRYSLQINFILNKPFFYSICFKKIFDEHKARDFRYNSFLRVSNYSLFEYICIAHTLDDLIETFFMNLLRGSGKYGLQISQVFQIFSNYKYFQNFY